MIIEKLTIEKLVDSILTITKKYKYLQSPQMQVNVRAVGAEDWPVGLLTLLPDSRRNSHCWEKCRKHMDIKMKKKCEQRLIKIKIKVFLFPIKYIDILEFHH